MGGGGVKMYIKCTKDEGVFSKRTKAYKGERGSKNAKFERIYLLNDPL